MKYILALCLLAACAPRASNELEEMSKDVLHSKQGIDIKITPVPKEK